MGNVFEGVRGSELVTDKGSIKGSRPLQLEGEALPKWVLPARVSQIGSLHHSQGRCLDEEGGRFGVADDPEYRGRCSGANLHLMTSSRAGRMLGLRLSGGAPLW